MNGHWVSKVVVIANIIEGESDILKVSNSQPYWPKLLVDQYNIIYKCLFLFKLILAQIVWLYTSRNHKLNIFHQ